MSQPLHKYLALGDSYTIGTGTEAPESWPFQLVRTLRLRGFSLKTPVIIAKNGWTTADLLESLSRISSPGHFDLVTLLIGVNDHYENFSLETYRTNFQRLLHRCLQFTDGRPESILVLSIPDWSVTPFARNRDPDIIRQGIAEFNEINRLLADKFTTRYHNITSLSRKAADDLELLADDELHPSSPMYTLWTESILPQVEKILSPS